MPYITTVDSSGPEDRDCSLGAICGKKAQYLRKHDTVFQAEVHAILARVYETETQDRPENYVSICCDSQAVLKALQVTKTTFPLV